MQQCFPHYVCCLFSQRTRRRPKWGRKRGNASTAPRRRLSSPGAWSPPKEDGGAPQARGRSLPGTPSPASPNLRRPARVIRGAGFLPKAPPLGRPPSFPPAPRDDPDTAGPRPGKGARPRARGTSRARGQPRPRPSRNRRPLPGGPRPQPCSHPATRGRARPRPSRPPPHGLQSRPRPRSRRLSARRFRRLHSLRPRRAPPRGSRPPSRLGVSRRPPGPGLRRPRPPCALRSAARGTLRRRQRYTRSIVLRRWRPRRSSLVRPLGPPAPALL